MKWAAGLMLALLAGCGELQGTGEQARILAMGDSMLAWNGTAHQSVSFAIEQELGEPVVDRSVSGAHVLYALPVSGAMGMKISKQYIQGKWDWIVLNGGGNDMWLGCGCVRCDTRIDRMISADGTSGAIAEHVAQLRATGAQVVYVGYLRSPGRNSPIEHCRDEGDKFDSRIARMAAADPGVHFISLADLVPYGDRSYHAFDMIHPSVKGSTAIGRRVARTIDTHD